MEQRSFDHGALVSRIGIGCSRVGSITNPVPMQEIEATLEAAVAAGVTLFDTADIYGQGDSERTLSRLKRRHRGGIFITTKVGFKHSRVAAFLRPVKPLLRRLARSSSQLNSTALQVRGATVHNTFPPERLRRAVDGCRRRLGVEKLDGLLLHSPSAETLRSAEIHAFLGELLDRQLASHVGAAIDTAEEVSAALTFPRLSILQIPAAITHLLEASAIEQIRSRNVAIVVREIFRKPGINTAAARRDAILSAIAPDFVTSAILGVSTRQHLNELLPVAS
jgi:aryl-alcohol dehydrogenase-like predicted oxidoreductase